MDPNRMFPLLFFLGRVLGSVATVSLPPETLDCTNDYDGTMSCDFTAQNCPEYTLVLETKLETEGCELKSHSGSCQCSVKVTMKPIITESFTATVWKGNRTVANKTFGVYQSVKPKTPNIYPVQEVKGNFIIEWKTNMEGHINNDLTAHLTYRKKADTGKLSARSFTVEGRTNFDVLGRDLEPSTTYVVSVRNSLSWSGKFSESSEEVEFRTTASTALILVPVIIGLSLVSILISAAIYITYVKIKTWWDTIAKCSNPKNLLLHSSEEKILKPAPLTISSVCVEPLVPDDSTSWSKGTLTDTSGGSPQHSSGISSGSSCLSYANTEPLDIKGEIQNALNKALANISPISPSAINPYNPYNPYNPCCGEVDQMSPGSASFDNKTYSIVLPGCQVDPEGSPEVQTQALVVCDPSYLPVENGASQDQQAPACPLANLLPVAPSLMPVDMSYQQCAVDSGGFSTTEDSGLCSLSGGNNTTAPCDPASTVKSELEGLDRVANAVCDENPCYRPASATPHACLTVDNDYQAFQNLVQQPDPEGASAEQEEHSGKYGDASFGKMTESFFHPPSFVNNVQSSQCLQSPFLPPPCADKSAPVITDGYQCV